MWAYYYLGLSPDADERAVKKAYAARLKQTRPEDDPKGFALLVEARDAAIHWAREQAEAGDLGPGAIADPDQAVLTRMPELIQIEPDPDVPAELKEKDGTSVLSEVSEPVRGDDIPSDPDQLVSPLARDPAPPEDDDLSTAPPLVHSAISAAQRETVDRLKDRIRRRLASWNATDPDDWDRILAEADTLSLNVRLEFELHLALVLNEALEKIVWQGGDYPPAEMAMIEKIGEDFGWLQNSRRVVGFFWPSDGTQPLPRVLHRILSRLPDPATNDNGVPLIDRFDLHIYYGSPSFPTVSYYEKSLRQGNLGPSWNWSAFIMPGGGLAHQRRLGLLSAILFVFGVVPLIVLSQVPKSWQPMTALVYGAMAIALHLAYGIFAQRLSILTLANIARETLRLAPYRDDARARVLGRYRTPPQFLIFLATLVFMCLIDIPAWQAIRVHFWD